MAAGGRQVAQADDRIIEAPPVPPLPLEQRFESRYPFVIRRLGTEGGVVGLRDPAVGRPPTGRIAAPARTHLRVTRLEVLQDLLLARKARAFGKCARAVAAVEMALVTPFLLLMFLGSVELSRYFMIAKRVSNAAANMANLLATSKTDLTEAELLFISQARMLVPSIAEDTPQGFSYADKHPVALASIEFRPTVAGCQDGCTYEAFVTDSFMLA